MQRSRKIVTYNEGKKPIKTDEEVTQMKKAATRTFQQFVTVFRMFKKPEEGCLGGSGS